MRWFFGLWVFAWGIALLVDHQSGAYLVAALGFMAAGLSILSPVRGWIAERGPPVALRLATPLSFVVAIAALVVAVPMD